MKHFYIDGFLVDWGASFFNQTKPTRAKSAPAAAARRRSQSTAAQSGGKIAQGRAPLGARAIRARLLQIARRSPQVVVRVYGGGRGMKQIRAHLRYIAREGIEGEIPLEDQDGFFIKGREQIQALSADWKAGGVVIEEISNRREAVNIVLSMPEGTDPLAVKKAARDFAAREFSNHKYAMALHTIDTPHYADDKDDPPSPNPHVHLIVKARGMDGTRVKRRKEDLRRWREGFAEALREHGVEASATTRAQRLDLPRGDRQTIRQMKERQKPFTRLTRGPAGPERIAKAKTTEDKIRGRYEEVTQLLAQSEDASDRRLAQELSRRFNLNRRVEHQHDAWSGPKRDSDEVDR